jgi:radical SAM superfamily enzyme YgiQ (UPF0313 family)
MRALLVNPWIYDFAAYDLWSKPLGLLEIAACLKILGVKVDLIDCQDRFHPLLKKYLKGKTPRASKFGCGKYHSKAIEKPAVFKTIPRRFKRYGFPRELFCEMLKKTPRPDIILVTSGMTYWYPAAFDVIKILRDRFDSVPILLGGIYARICFPHAREKSGADIVYNGGNIREILNLVSAKTGAKFDYARLDEKKRLFADYGLYPKLSYATLRTSSGCPFRCSYCAWYLLEKGFTQKNPEHVLDEIEHLYKKRRVKNFAFYDEALLYSAERHIIRIMEGLLERKIDAHFHTPNGLHVKFIDSQIATFFKKTGFVQPRLGLETTSKNRQAETGGKATTEEFLKAVDFLKSAGYRSSQIGVNILMGLPGQSIEEVRGAVEFIALERMRIFLEEYSPIPNTPEYEKAGLPNDADPLLHNNSVFPLYHPEDRIKLQALKNLAHRFNARLNLKSY